MTPTNLDLESEIREAGAQNTASAAQPVAAAVPAIDAADIGDTATAAVSACLEAADDIETMMAHVQSVADQIKSTGKALAGDFRMRADMLKQIVTSFAKLSTASAMRMSDERKHLEEIASQGRQGG